MTLEFDIFKQSIQISLIYALILVILHVIIKILAPYIIPKYNILNEFIRSQINNRFVSVFHAIVMCSYTYYYWIYINPSRVISERNDWVQAFSLDIMMGYLYYDIIYEFISTKSIDTLGHHIIGLLSHLSSRLSNNGAAGYYSMLVYIAEITTPLLHASWLMHSLNYKHTLIFKLTAAVLIILFFICRCLLGVYMVSHLILFKHMWNDSKGYLFWFNFTIVFMFALLNWFWFYKLLQVALKPSKKTSEVSSKDQ